MKTSLHFEAPSDLSVGTVRITGGGETIADWVATPDRRTFQQDDLKPGIYSADIGPAGVAPQSVVFEVKEGQANTVVLPTFSALSSSGSNTCFFDIATQEAVSEIPLSTGLDVAASIKMPFSEGSTSSSMVREDTLKLPASEPFNVSGGTRRISIGLSEERRGRERFDIFRGRTRMESVPGRLELEIPTDPTRDHWAGNRVRLSVAIEEARIERCLLPLYRGGTRISVTVPAFAPADVGFAITPADPKLRALVRSLDAGTSAEVAAVRDDILRNYDPDCLLASHADPWAAILAGLLAIRFPEIFSPIDAAWVDELVQHAGWAFDAHIIRASRLLSAADERDRGVQDKAVGDAVAALANAQVTGSPYYRFTNQRFGEIASGIADYLKTKDPRIDAAAARKFDLLYTRWHRELPLQRGAGSTFTWLARDPVALKKHKVLVPYRSPSGRLRRNYTTVIFEGKVGAGQIEIIGGARGSEPPLQEGHSAPRPALDPSDSKRAFSLSQMPALRRPPGPDDDPNKGRFGGKAEVGGFHLDTSFEPTNSRNWISVVLTVVADSSTKLGLGDFAWFVLHPTFSPPALKVLFRGNRARLRIQSRGSFTTGVWLPKSGVELESDLAELEDAPKIIKQRSAGSLDVSGGSGRVIRLARRAG